MRILIKRAGALGDVVATTPVARELRRRYPTARIVVETACPDVYLNSPDVDEVLGIGRAQGAWDLAVDLDMSYEHARHRHPLDVYEELALDVGEKIAAEFRQAVLARPELPEGGGINWAAFPFERTVVIHPNVSWRNRTLSAAWWARLAANLVDLGWLVVTTGSTRDHAIAGPDVLDIRGRLSLASQATLIARSRVFVCGDSGMYAVAGTTETPIVVMSTISRPRSMAAWRGGVLGRGSTFVVPDLPCVGCNDRAPSGATFVGCERRDFACVDAHDAMFVAALAQEAATDVEAATMPMNEVVANTRESLRPRRA